ncbi:hypothetical protein DIPPA_31682 [Diplonema papillatum]|nr:hypothetical protein DIPPA_31682 [Diplonema papillatum]
MAHQSLDWSNWEAVRVRKAAAAEPTVEMDERERLAVMLLQEKKAAVRKLIGPAKLKAQEPH